MGGDVGGLLLDKGDGESFVTAGEYSENNLSYYNYDLQAAYPPHAGPLPPFGGGLSAAPPSISRP